MHTRELIAPQWSPDDERYCPGSGIVAQRTSRKNEKVRCPACGRRVGMNAGAISYHFTLDALQADRRTQYVRTRPNIRIGISTDDCELIRRLIDVVEGGKPLKPKERAQLPALREKVAW